MKELLSSRGWPTNLTNEQIIHMLPDLWKKLEAEGLLKDLVARGFGYREFVNIALAQKAKADAMADMHAFFNNRGGR